MPGLVFDLILLSSVVFCIRCPNASLSWCVPWILPYAVCLLFRFVRFCGFELSDDLPW